MSINSNNVLMRLVKDVNDIKASLRRVVSNLPLYDIANENSPAAISTNQNNYTPGNYDILRLNATADLTITGFRGGVKGRFLEILNVGTGRITYTDGDLNSLPENRFNLPYDNSVTQLPNARVRFYYDSTQQRWTLSDAPNIQGLLGKAVVLKNSVDQIGAALANGPYTLIKPDVVSSDEWGYWNSSLGRFVIPSGDNGLFSLSVNFRIFGNLGVGDTMFASMRILGNGTVIYSQQNFKRDSTEPDAYVAGTTNMLLSAGDYIEVYAQKTSTPSGASVVLYRLSANTPIFTFLKVS